MPKYSEHKESKALVKVVYFTSKTLANGSHPFMVRITKDGKRKYVATNLSLPPDQWDKKRNTFRKNVHPNKKKEFELAFHALEEKYSSAADTLADADEQHDARAVAAFVSQQRNELRQFKLLGYFDELINKYLQTGKVGNCRVYRDVRNNIQQYIGNGEDIPFSAVTVKFCNDWEMNMRSNGLSEVTISIKFRTLRSVLNKAIANGYAKPETYPFARNTAETHKFQTGKFNLETTKRAISKLSISKIEAFEPTLYTGPYASLRDTSKRQQLAKDLFLFSYYCGGINFIDMAHLRWSNIIVDLTDNQRLNYNRLKTGGKFSIKLKPIPLSILNRYKKSIDERLSTYIFPILNDMVHITPLQRQNRCNKILTQVNADLKYIGKSLNINVPLTTYVARHSFATSLRMSGQDISVISQAMGHRDESTTKIYLKELGTELIDAAFDDL